MFKSLINRKCSVDSYKIIQHIYKNIDKFNYNQYKWITKGGGGHEKELCNLLGWKFVNKRHWDADFNDIKIELKKSKSNGIQVDEIRYAEEVLEINSDCMENITTIFMEIYSNQSKKNGIRKIIIVQNEEIIKLLNIPHDYCCLLHNRNEEIKTGLSFTHRLKYSDLINVSEAYIIFE
jgi:hypothetical protein